MSLKNKCKYFLKIAYSLKENHEISNLLFYSFKDLIFSYNSTLFLIENEEKNEIISFLLNYLHNCYELLYEDLTLERAHILATSYVDEMNDTDTRALVYGEIDFISFTEVLKVATDNLYNYKKFIDLGHGIGRAVIVVFYFFFLFLHF